MNNELNQNQALEVLVKTALLAQSKGILSLEDAVIVKQAIDVFVKQTEQGQQLEMVEDGERSEE